MENKAQLFVKKNSTDSSKDAIYVNGEFEGSLTGWNTYWGITYGDGKALALDRTQNSIMQQNITLFAGAEYEVEFKVEYFYGPSPSSEYMRVQVGDNFEDVTKSGTYKFLCKSAGGSNQIYIFKRPGPTFKLDYIRIKQLQQYDYDEVELYDDGSIQLNMSIGEVEDITKRNITYSQSFVVPGTNINNQLFGYLYDLDIDEPVVYLNKQIDCSLYYSDTLFMQGFLELTKVYLNESSGMVEYECNVFSSMKTFSNILNESYVTGNDDASLDIDFSAYNHILNIGNITNSWGMNSMTSPGYGYYYPVMNYNNLQNGNMVVEDFRPALYAKEIFDKIVNKVGYTYTSTFLNSNEFKSLVVPCITDFTTDQDELNSRGFKVGYSADWNALAQSSYTAYPYKESTIPMTNETAYDFFDSGSTYNPSTFINTISKKGLYQFTVSSFMSIELSMNNLATVQYIFPKSKTAGENPKVAVNLYIYRRRAGVYTELASNTTYFYLNTSYLAVKNGVIGTIANQTGTATMSSPQTFEVGDEIFCVARIYNVYNNWFNNIGQNIGATTNAPNSVAARLIMKSASPLDATKPGTFFKGVATPSTYLFEGDWVNMNSVFPEKVKKLDFVTSIIKMFNLVVDIDKDDETNLIIDTRDNYFSSGTSLNWTSKINRDDNFEIERIPNIIDSDIIFTYQNDSDDLNTNYTSLYPEHIFGDKQILSTGLTADNQFKVDVMFSPTPSAKIPNTDLIVPKLFTTDSSGKVGANNFNVRILYRSPVTLWSAAFNNQITTSNPRVRIAYKGGVYINAGVLYTASHFDNPYDPKLDLNWDTCFKYYQEPVAPCYDTLYNRFWRKQITQLNDENSKKVTCYANLTELDMFNFSFADQVQVDEQYYVVDKIVDWKPDALTKVVLLKLVEPNLPTTDPDKKWWWNRDWYWRDYQYQNRLRLPYEKNLGYEAIESNWYNKNTNISYSRYNTDSFVETGTTSGTTEEYVSGNTNNYQTILNGRGYNIGYGGYVSAENFFVGGINHSIEYSNNVVAFGESHTIGFDAGNVAIIGGKNNIISPNIKSSVIIGGENLVANQSNITILGGKVLSKSPVQTIINVISGNDNRFNRFKQAHVLSGMFTEEGVRTYRKSIDEVFVVSPNVYETTTPTE